MAYLRSNIAEKNVKTYAGNLGHLTMSHMSHTLNKYFTLDIDNKHIEDIKI